MIGCDICLKTFKRRDNMLRHKKTVHVEEGADGSESGASSDENSDSDMSDYDSHETGEEYDPWENIVEQAFEKCQPEFEEAVEKLTEKRNMDETDARTQAYEDLIPTYRKAAMHTFVGRMVWFRRMRKDPIYRAIAKTAKYLEDVDDYDNEEALKYAASKRKYLLDKMLNTYEPPEMDSKESVDQDDADEDDSDMQEED